MDSVLGKEKIRAAITIRSEMIIPACDPTLTSLPPTHTHPLPARSVSPTLASPTQATQSKPGCHGDPMSDGLSKVNHEIPGVLGNVPPPDCPSLSFRCAHTPHLPCLCHKKSQLLLSHAHCLASLAHQISYCSDPASTITAYLLLWVILL